MNERERFKEWINGLAYFTDNLTIRQQAEKKIMYKAWQARAEIAEKEKIELDQGYQKWRKSWNEITDRQCNQIAELKKLLKETADAIFAGSRIRKCAIHTAAYKVIKE